MSAAEFSPEQAEVSPRDERVVRWRFDQLIALGFGEDDAWMLVDSDADLQLVRSLVGSGCPLHLALRIAL